MTMRIVGAARGNPYSPLTASGAASHLFDALARRYELVDRIDVTLTRPQRLAVAASSFDRDKARWRNRFYRSALGYALQSRNSQRALRRIDRPFDLVVQIFGLFRTVGAPYAMYLDNTHEITRRLWPEWSPFSDRQVERLYARERQAYHEAAHLFAAGKAVESSLVAFYGVPAERVTVVATGVNFDPLPEPGREERDPVVLFVGRAYAGGKLKGLDVLLEAFTRVRGANPEARLQIIGTSDVPAAPGVEVLGRIDDRSVVAAHFRRAAVFCLPSRFEGYGGAACEAMAFGLPCVVTDVGALPEAVLAGQTGLVVPPADATALADALSTLLADVDLARRLGDAGRERVASYLTWDAVVDRMAPALERLGR